MLSHWSSAPFHGALARALSEGYGAGDAGAVGAGAFDFEGGADEAGAIVHDAQAQAGGGVGLEVWEGQAVVLDGKQELAREAGEEEGDAFGFAVLDGIGDGFLGDFV